MSALLCAVGLVGHAAGAGGVLVEPAADVCALLLGLALALTAVSLGLRRAALLLAGAVLLGVPVAWLGRAVGGLPPDPLTLLVLWVAAAALVAHAPQAPERRALSERIRTEARLRETEATARALFDRASQGIARIALDGTLERCNPALCQLSGFAREELEGRPFLEFVSEEDVDYAAEAFVQVVGGREPRQQFELRFARKDGSWYWGRGCLTLVYDDAGAPSFAVGLLDDVTERLHHARRLEALNRQLESQNRELERFASVVAHDLQEPLLTVRLFAEHLEEGQAERLDDEGRDFLARIRRAGGHMQELIESLLSLTRITSRASAFVEVDLVLLVREVLADLDRRLQEAQGEVVVGPLPTLRADPAQLRQLFQNLLGNALKFHRPGVPPRVRVESRQDRDPDGALLYTITVADNGIGFDPDEIDRMFEPLQRLDGARAYEGTGMGLAICRKIVERHGGHLTALGRPGEGGTLMLTLPAGVPADEPPPQDLRHQPSPLRA